MLHVRFAEGFQSDLGNALGKPKKSRLHIRRQVCDFGYDRFVRDFHAPSHDRLYLIFEIMERAFPFPIHSGRVRLAELKAQMLEAERELSSMEEAPQILALHPATLDSYIATVDRLAAVLTSATAVPPD